MFTRTGAVFSLPPAARGCSAEEGAVSSWHSPPAPFWGPHTPQMGARELPLPPRWCPQHPAAPSHEGKPPAPPQEMLGGGCASPSHGLETRNPISTVSSGRAGRVIWVYFIFFSSSQTPHGHPVSCRCAASSLTGLHHVHQPSLGHGFCHPDGTRRAHGGGGHPKNTPKTPPSQGLGPTEVPTRCSAAPEQGEGWAGAGWDVLRVAAPAPAQKQGFVQPVAV